MHIEKLSQYGRNALAMRSHTDDSGNAFDGFWQAAFVEITVVQHTPVGYVLNRIKVSCVTSVVTDIELIVMHCYTLSRSCQNI
jgi:hypothetical protein